MTMPTNRRPAPRAVVANVLIAAPLAFLAPVVAHASDADLRLPDLNSVRFFAGPDGTGGIGGHTLLTWGLVICVAGLLFGLYYYRRLKRLPVHRSMLDVSELIYATCKTYLKTQGKFILLLWVFIAAIMVAYFGFLTGSHSPTAVAEPAGPAGTIVHEAAQISTPVKVLTILLFSLIGIAGSYSVAWFGIRINTFANSRTAMGSLSGRAWPCCDIPLQAGMSIGMVLISVELILMLIILLFVPVTLAGPCFIGFAIGESLGAAALRVAGGIFTKIADIGADLMKIVFNVKEDDARNPGVIADCTGDNAGDSVGPTADGFETYGVTGVALITFILLAIPNHDNQVKLLVWIFVMRLVMLIASGLAYLVNHTVAARRYADVRRMNFESPLRSLVWLASLISIACTYIASYVLIKDMEGGALWWKLASIITCGTLAGAIIPEVTTLFTSVHSTHTREVLTSSREGGASLNILAGLTAGNFSAFWIGGIVIAALMAGAYGISTMFPENLMLASSVQAVFAFGLVAFGFLGMGPVTIAVDSYGPVTDNAQSVYELSQIEEIPNVEQDVQGKFGFKVNFKVAKELLEENDGAGNTFKATAKPVLIGTAVVGATTMIFSIIVLLTNGLTDQASMANLSIMHAP
ncbi:MAG TPA: sodium-translocating pyrophosphatase, partial [Tepidisphaeraceae bacterium]